MKRILLVDKEPVFLNKAKSYLEKETGFEVITEKTTKEAIKKIKEKEINCIISSYQLKNSDSIKLLKKIRRNLEKQTPFILLTKTQQKKIPIKSIDLGINRYIIKDDGTNNLLKRLIEAIEQETTNIETTNINSLDKKDRRLRTLQKNLPGVTYRCLNNQNYTMKYLSEGFKKLTGYKPSEIINDREKSFIELILKEDREKIRKKIDHKIKKQEPYKISYRVKTKKDQIKWLWEQGRAVKKRESKPDTLEGVIINITKRKEIEKRQKLFTLSLDQASIEIYWINSDGKFCYVNDKTTKKLGIPKNELLEMNVWDIDPELTEEKWRNHWKKLKEQKSLDFETKHKKSNGESYPAEVTSHYIPRNNQEYEFSFVKDISKKKRTRERKNFLNRLLRHDVKNKNQIIRGYLELLNEELEKDNGYLNKAVNAIEESERIIENIRALCKVEGEKTKSKDLVEVIREVVNDKRDLAEQKDIKIKTQGLENTKKVLAGELLNELFSNIIENSIYHSEATKIEVIIKEDEEKIKSIIKDDGSGIPEKIRKRVFERGFKYGESGKTGLGLYIAKEITESYGGNIELKKSDQKGARFDIALRKIG